ncbi:MAG TPA: hypothetical protein VHD76_03180 [Bryobacteraceae bacterium]|jgi:hypothetical protein|nr:hypothetical protein [Bryobacteraceae bacterium]
MKPAARTLGLFRVAFYATVFLIYFGLDDRPWTRVSPAFWMPVSVFRFLDGPPRDALWMGVSQTVWKVSLLASAAGVLTRFSTFVSAALAVYLLGLPQNFGKIDHMDGIVVILLGILFVSRCGDGVSVDNFLSRKIPGTAPREAEPVEYRWPIVLGQVLFTLVFFAAGVAKLRVSGLAWMSSGNLRHLLIEHQYTHAPLTDAGLIAARSTMVCGGAAILTIVLELSMPLAVLSRRLRWPLLIALLFLQIGIALALGVYFTPYLAGYLLFVPWERWPPRFLTRSRPTVPEVSGGTRTARPA